jgi:hypothetical protein
MRTSRKSAPKTSSICLRVPSSSGRPPPLAATCAATSPSFGTSRVKGESRLNIGLKPVAFGTPEWLDALGNVGGFSVGTWIGGAMNRRGPAVTSASPIEAGGSRGGGATDRARTLSVVGIAFFRVVA